ncbi:MAG: hypothetical protein ACP5OA_02635 [Candidatus Woesearchaeota archaeon]
MVLIEIDIGKVIYADTDSDIPEDKIIYRDLVTTLNQNPHKYLLPVVDKDFRLTRNSLFYTALKDAGLSKIVVELEGLSNHPIHSSDSGYLNRVFDDYVFFDKDALTYDAMRTEEVSKAISENLTKFYLACVRKTIDPLLNKGVLDSMGFSVLGQDLLNYWLGGKIKGDLSYMYDDKKDFYSRMEETLGPIRSVNGIKLH